MEDEEEDVVFVNSPLYTHLSEVGFTDFDAQNVNNSSKEYDMSNNASSSLEFSQNTKNRNPTTAFLDLLEKLYGLVLWFLLPVRTSKELACCFSYISLIKSSRLLTDDDLEFVYRFEQSVPLVNDSGCNRNPTQNISSSINKQDKKSTDRNSFSLLFFATSDVCIGLVLLLATLVGSLSISVCPWSTILIIIFCALLSLYLILKVYSLWQSNRIDHQNIHNQELLQKYLQITKELLILIKKAILFIQEKELLVRGHVILSPMAPVTRLESNSALHGQPGKQCFMLRKCIVDDIRKYIGVIINETKELSHSSFFNNSGMFKWLDKDSIRMDYEFMKLDLDCISSIETGDCSLAALKRLLHCLVRQQSLLLLYTVLNLLSTIASIKQSQKSVNVQNSFPTCFGNLLQNGKICLDSIKQCYAFHKVGIPADGLAKKEPKTSGEKLGTTFSPFFMAVHSMNLHLQETIKTSFSLEEKLEGRDGGSDPLEGFVVKHFKELDNDFMRIKSNMENLMSCWDESHGRLEEIFLNSKRMHGLKGLRAESKTNVEHSPDPQNDETQVLSLSGNNDVVSDQIFEGETFSEFDDETISPSTLGREELFSEEKAREESRYLLRELKSVLATRDEEAMVEIPRALLEKKSDDKSVIRKAESKAINLDLIDDESAARLLKDTFNKVPDITDIGERKSEYPELGENSNKCCEQKPFSSGTGTFARAMFITEEEEKGNNIINPFACIVAAAAVARNKELGLKEQSYEIDSEAETFGNETNSDSD